MAGVSLPGLGSGLDTSSIVKQLMQIESLPQTALKTRVTTSQKAVTALQGINTKVLALKAAAEKLYKPAVGTIPASSDGPGWSAVKSTASTSSVAVSSLSTADPGTLRFNVTSLADSFFIATSAVAENTPITGEPPTLQFSLPDGSTATVTPATSYIASVVSAINSANMGVRAASIAQADGTMRLQLTSAKSGADQGFSVTGLTVDTPITHQGSDAVIDFGSGLTASSSSNTFANLMPGTSVTVSKVENDVSITATKDDKAVTDTVKALVDAANAALSEIRTQTAATPSTTAGKAGTSSPLTGDSTVRSLTMALQSAISSSGVSPAEAGITISRDGTYAFDADKFTKLLESDPAKAQSLASGFAQRMGEVATAASDSKSGSLTSSITNRQSRIKDLNQQVDAWDTRLELRQAALQKQFTALDVAMQQMNSQSSWLSGALSGLPTYNNSSQ